MVPSGSRTHLFVKRLQQLIYFGARLAMLFFFLLNSLPNTSTVIICSTFRTSVGHGQNSGCRLGCSRLCLCRRRSANGDLRGMRSGSTKTKDLINVEIGTTGID